MIEVTKTIEWDMGHRVPNHRNQCRNFHGHRYRLELTIAGDLDEAAGTSSEGMVIDFGDIKALMREHVHDALDHSFMAYEGDSLARRLLELDTSQRIIFVPFIPTAENIACWCYRQMRAAFPPHLTISRCRVYETPTSCATFTPSDSGR